MVWPRRYVLAALAAIFIFASGVFVLRLDSWDMWEMQHIFAGTCEIPESQFQPVEFYTTPDREYILRDFTKLPAVKELSGPDTAWDDPKLIKLIRDELLDPPRPYLAKQSYPLFKTPQAQTVDDIFKWKANGFFVECGALDGERSSNTIWLEQKCGWTGLLVEMDPSYYLQLRGKNRRSYSANVCLSPESNPMIINFKEDRKGSGKLVGGQTTGASEQAYNEIPTFCVPFYSLMLAMNRTKIDYFSLDVEGFELPILKTIPFDKLDISVFTVECIRHSRPGHKSQKSNEQVKFMASKGYEVYTYIHKDFKSIGLFVHDFVFVKRGLRV